MNINFTIGLSVIEFLCHFGAMVCYVGVGVIIENEGLEQLSFLFALITGITLTTIGANL